MFYLLSWPTGYNLTQDTLLDVIQVSMELGNESHTVCHGTVCV